VTKILVIGGSGYVGSSLIPTLLDTGFDTRNIDLEWFGHFFPIPISHLTCKKDVADVTEEDLKDIEHVIYLASVANDPSVDLNPAFSWEVNTLRLSGFLDFCRRKGKLKSLIFASSGSVYGLSDAERVHEDIELVPLSAYNKTKQVAERICLSYQNDFNVHIVRPATVCGLSPRMRFDVVVNLFVLQAFQSNVITVTGGKQIRPNIHMKDMVSVYLHFLKNWQLPSGTYNAGFENLEIGEIAELVAKVSGAKVNLVSSNDPRSYRLDSTKLLGTGFKREFSVSEAVSEMFEALKNGAVLDDPRFHTVRWMKREGIGAKL
jgi:nucleoside-diphosphate-sugar epimerase